jgi:hypothetical protein
VWVRSSCNQWGDDQSTAVILPRFPTFLSYYVGSILWNTTRQQSNSQVIVLSPRIEAMLLLKLSMRHMYTQVVLGNYVICRNSIFLKAGTRMTPQYELGSNSQ